MVLECQGVDKLLRAILNILISLSLDKITPKATPPTRPCFTVCRQGICVQQPSLFPVPKKAAGKKQMHDGTWSVTKLRLMVQLGLLQFQDIQHLWLLGLLSEALRAVLIMLGSGLPYCCFSSWSPSYLAQLLILFQSNSFYSLIQQLFRHHLPKKLTHYFT